MYNTQGPRHLHLQLLDIPPTTTTLRPVLAMHGRTQPKIVCVCGGGGGGGVQSEVQICLYVCLL